MLRFLLTARIIQLVLMSTIFGLSKWHSIVEMKGLSHPRFIDQNLQRIRKERALSLNQIAILETGTRKSQMSNCGQDSKVANQLLLWPLPMGCRSITSIVSIARRKIVPMNPQMGLDA